jgi:multidrug resistance protein MdtO
MMTAAQTPTAWPRPLSWLGDFLREELAPYPGRAALVARMVVAATVVMIINMTYQVPYAAYGAVYAITISREDTEATVRAVKTIVISYTFAAIDVLIGAALFSADPNLRLVWVVGTLFIMFFALSTATNYTAAARFGYLIVITILLWDEHTSAENKVEGTLWAFWTITVASVITAGIELLFAALRPRDDLAMALDERLTVVEEVTRACAAGQAIGKKAADRVTSLVLLGTSRLRRFLQRSSPSLTYGEQMGATVVLVGRLVDIAANLTVLNNDVFEQDRKRFQTLADHIANIRAALMSGRIPQLIPALQDNAMPHSIPLLREMEQTAALIPEVFAGSRSFDAFAPEPLRPDPPTRLLVPDAFTNLDHLKFALRGCLAASFCYFTYSLLDWPGISTSVTTCFLTALTTVGASRQKQLLRFAGAIIGGAIGIASQVWILPNLDSIFGFTLLFLAVTVAGAWVMTSGSRLSYCGVQILIAFYLVNLQEFKIQTSLTPARDRVVGILLGLFMMWLMFDQLWAAPAGVEMRRTFISVFRSLAQLFLEPRSTDLRIAVERSFSLRETINRGLNQVRALADGVVLEFGPSRNENLAWRNRIVRWQPQLRVLFLTRVTLFKYRLQLPGFELPEPVRVAQQQFDECLTANLNAMADRMEGKDSQTTESLELSFARLEAAIRSYGTPGPQAIPASHLETFLPLSRRLESLTVSLAKEI